MVKFSRKEGDLLIRGRGRAEDWEEKGEKQQRGRGGLGTKEEVSGAKAQQMDGRVTRS